MSPQVAVIVVSWNTCGLLRECLASLEPARGAGLAEVWVVDNCSEDGSAEMVDAEFPHVHLLQPDRNLGFGAGVNLAAEASQTPWLVAANADTAVSAGALEALLGAAATDPELGAVVPRLVGADGDTQHSVFHFPTVALSAAIYSSATALPGVGDRLCIEGHWNPERPRAVNWALGAFMLFSRKAFEQVGGFDPEQWMYAEDIDIAWRLREAGFRIDYVPAARVTHAGGASTAQAFGDARRTRYMDATFAWMVRRRGIGVTWCFAAVNLVGCGLRYGLTLPAAALGSQRAKRSGAVWRSYLPIHRRGLRSRARLLDAR